MDYTAKAANNLYELSYHFSMKIASIFSYFKKYFFVYTKIKNKRKRFNEFSH